MTARIILPRWGKISHLQGVEYVSGRRSRRITWISILFHACGRETLRGFSQTFENPACSFLGRVGFFGFLYERFLAFCRTRCYDTHALHHLRPRREYHAIIHAKKRFLCKRAAPLSRHSERDAPVCARHEPVRRSGRALHRRHHGSFAAAADLPPAMDRLDAQSRHCRLHQLRHQPPHAHDRVEKTRPPHRFKDPPFRYQHDALSLPRPAHGHSLR